jgi:hypothetical protein
MPFALHALRPADAVILMLIHYHVAPDSQQKDDVMNAIWSEMI